jgi:hypothetical protein
VGSSGLGGAEGSPRSSDADSSGEFAIACDQATAKKGVYGISQCCEHCHGRDGLQKVFLDGEMTHLCCTVISDIMNRWPASIEYTDEFRGRRPVAPKLRLLDR